MDKRTYNHYSTSLAVTSCEKWHFQERPLVQNKEGGVVSTLCSLMNMNIHRPHWPKCISDDVMVSRLWPIKGWDVQVVVLLPAIQTSSGLSTLHDCLKFGSVWFVKANVLVFFCLIEPLQSQFLLNFPTLFFSVPPSFYPGVVAVTNMTSLVLTLCLYLTPLFLCALPPLTLPSSCCSQGHCEPVVDFLTQFPPHVNKVVRPRAKSNTYLEQALLVLFLFGRLL